MKSPFGKSETRRASVWQSHLNKYGFASKVRQFNVSFTPGLSPVIGGCEKFAKPF